MISKIASTPVFSPSSQGSVEFRRQSRGRRESGDEQISLDEADQSCGHFSKRNTRSLEFIVKFRYAVLDDVLKNYYVVGTVVRSVRSKSSKKYK